MSTGGEGIGASRAGCSGEANQGPGGGKSTGPVRISDGESSDEVRVLDESGIFVGTKKLKSANTEIESRKGKGLVDSRMSNPVDASRQRVVELMSSDDEWECLRIMNLVEKVLRGQHRMDDEEEEDGNNSETRNGIHSSSHQNRRNDVMNREPVFQKESVMNETVFSNDVRVGISSCPRVEATGNRYLVINEPVPDHTFKSHVVLDCESHCEGVADSRSVCGKLKPAGLNGIYAANTSFLEETGEEDKNESEFNVSDIVWGKVRSHPWWPGQIFRASAASEKAIGYFKKDSCLIAYFGDRTFSWTGLSKIKPFRAHFSEMEKQSSGEIFRDAVNCALDEVARRVEFGLACRCLPKQVYMKIESQVVQNTGIQEKSSIVKGGDSFSSAASFSPGEFLQLIESFAETPHAEINRLQLGIAKAQLLAFSRWKGYYQLPVFEHGEILEDGAVAGAKVSQDMVNGVFSDPINVDKIPSKMGKSGGKRVSWQRKSGKKMASSSKKRCLGSSLQSDSHGKRPKTMLSGAGDPSLSAGKTVCRAFVSGRKCTGCTMRGSGKRIRSKTGKHVASKMTLSSLDPGEILSKLKLAAQNPLQAYGALAPMVGLIHEIRNSPSKEKPSGKKQFLNLEVLKNAMERDVSATELDANAGAVVSLENRDAAGTSTGPMNEEPRRIMKG